MSDPADNLGWEYEPELEPFNFTENDVRSVTAGMDAIGRLEAFQDRLFEAEPDPRPEWALSRRAKQLGLDGVRAAKDAARRARGQEG